MFKHESEFENHKYLFMKVINSINIIKNNKLKNLLLEVSNIKETGLFWRCCRRNNQNNGQGRIVLVIGSEFILLKI